MADPKLQGLFAELGIGSDNEDAALQKATQDREIGGSSNFAAAFNAGNANRGGIQQLISGAASGIGGLITGEGGRSAKEFGRDVAAGMKNSRDTRIAQGMNLKGGVQELRRNRKVREALNSVKVPNSGDPTADQLAQLDEIIKIANKHGDTQLIARAHQKKMQVKMQQEAFEKADLANKKEESEQEIQAEIDSTGHTVRLVEDDPEGAVSKAMRNDDGTWTIVRPDGTTLPSVDGIRLKFVDPAVAAALGKLRTRKWESLPAQMQATLTANKIDATKKRGELADFGQQAIIVSDMTDGLLGMYDPRIALAESQSVATGADKALTLVDTFANLFTRKGQKPSNITYGDGPGQKRVTAQQQYDLATNPDILESFLSENNVSLQDIMPAHLRGDVAAAQLFQANVMQLAFLDARLFEPSNRGLSDNDIKAALARIGIGSPNPAVFANRQQISLRRLVGRLDNLGTEFSALPGSDVTKRDLQEFVYQPDVTDRIRGELTGSIARLDSFLSTRSQESGGTRPEPGQEGPAQPQSDDDFLNAN